jgi:hypothetical protein
MKSYSFLFLRALFDVPYICGNLEQIFSIINVDVVVGGGGGDGDDDGGGGGGGGVAAPTVINFSQLLLLLGIILFASHPCQLAFQQLLLQYSTHC